MQVKEIIMYVLMTAACIIPIILFVRAASAKTRLVTKSIKRLTGKMPKEYDVWQTRGIAYDAAGRLLVYINHDTETPVTVSLSISTIDDIQLFVNGRKSATDRKTLDPAGVNAIDLQITADQKQPYVLRFFDMEQDGPFQANFHYQLAKKWKKLMQEAVGSRPVGV